ncbi:MAG: hypothetical protein HQL99_06580 [Magnetococcales bacterium]|nr:hypothetical protein [Magnetococcales bacterium]
MNLKRALTFPPWMRGLSTALAKRDLTLPSWMAGGLSSALADPVGRLRERLGKKKAEGLAALYATGDGVGLVHLASGAEGRMRVLVCAFQPLVKGQSPGRVAQGMVKAHKLEKARFVGVLDRGSYVLIPAEAPDLPREEWAAAMKWRIKDQLSFPVTQAVLEVFDMPGNAPDAESGRIYVAAARDGEVRRHVALFQEAGVNLIALDIPELALLNLTIGLVDEREGMGLLHLERKSGLVMMVKAGWFYLARRIENGLDTLMDSLEPDGSGVSDAPFLDRIALETQRTMDYFESHYSQAAASTLYVVPLSTPVEGFRQALAERLGMRIKYLPLEEILEVPATVAQADLVRALPAIGAAMRVGAGEA